jgi:hypothetical protein
MKQLCDFFSTAEAQLENCGGDIAVDVSIIGISLPEKDKKALVKEMMKFIDEITKELANSYKDGLEEFLKTVDLFYPETETQKSDDGLIDPIEMLNDEYADKCFQQYSDGQPCKWFYKNCGRCEENVVCVWWDDEDEKYRLSTDSEESLSTLSGHIKCKVIDESKMPVFLP